MIKLYNTLSRKKEELKPIVDGEVGLYTCGPTVYDYAHLGNLRAFYFYDILKRVLKYNGYKVKHIMNITDVGHLTGDMDMGEDKLEKGAKREGKTAWDVAKFFEEAFLNDLKRLNILEPSKWTHATKYIQEQIDLIKILEEKGYIYITSDGVYYDTSKFKDYNKLSHLDLETLEEGARVEKNAEKKNATDFALWKFSPESSKRDMEWESPWGVGFPGWHIECSAMSKSELDEQLDIHCGGADHINVHHTNEIAQSEAAFEKPFFNYWMHNAFLNIVGGKKMSKSSGDFLTLQNTFVDKNINPLVYRFASLQTHFRKPMEYSEEAMLNAKKGFERLQNKVRELGNEQGEIVEEYKNKFLNAINDDLNTAQALAVMQEVLKSDNASADKLATVIDFDKVFGLDLNTLGKIKDLPTDIEKLKVDRIKAREEKNWEESDRLRDEIEALGYIVKDSQEGMSILKK